LFRRYFKNQLEGIPTLAEYLYYPESIKWSQRLPQINKGFDEGFSTFIRCYLIHIPNLLFTVILLSHVHQGLITILRHSSLTFFLFNGKLFKTINNIIWEHRFKRILVSPSLSTILSSQTLTNTLVSKNSLRMGTFVRAPSCLSERPPRSATNAT
jgi:hypothetical protein